MKNIFSKTKQKISEKKGIIFTVLQISQISGLIRDGWSFLSASAFSLLCYHTSNSLWKTPPYTQKRMSMEKKVIGLENEATNQ